MTWSEFIAEPGNQKRIQAMAASQLDDEDADEKYWRKVAGQMFRALLEHGGVFFDAEDEIEVGT